VLGKKSLPDEGLKENILIFFPMIADKNIAT
jgi:hypothetical protein